MISISSVGIIFLFYVIKTQIIKIPLKTYLNELPQPKVYFPNENCSEYLPLNTFTQYSLFFSSFIKFNTVIIPNIKENITLSLEEHYSAIHYITNITINNTIVTNLSVYLSTDSVYDLDGGISLSYHPKDESFSIVHNLYNNHQISKRQFAFENPNIRGNAFFYIGGIEEKKHLLMRYKGKIKINETLPTWGFTMNSITYNDIHYTINESCVIHTGINQLIRSKKIFDIINIIIKECDENSNLNTEKNIDFIINNIIISLPIKLVVKKIKNYYITSEIKYNIARRNNIKCVLGGSFLNLFNYSLFDYDNKQIEFYSDSIIIKYLKNEKCEHFIFLIISIICIIKIIELIYIIHNINK